jgi:hypothetical protein
MCRYELETDNEEYNNGIRERMAQRSAPTTLSTHPCQEDSTTLQCELMRIGCCSRDADESDDEVRVEKLESCGHRFHSSCLESAALVATCGIVSDMVRCPMCL